MEDTSNDDCLNVLRCERKRYKHELKRKSQMTGAPLGYLIVVIHSCHNVNSEVLILCTMGTELQRVTTSRFFATFTRCKRDPVHKCRILNGRFKIFKAPMNSLSRGTLHHQNTVLLHLNRIDTMQTPMV